MTAQFHEKLILEGEVTGMAFCPPLPFGHPRLLEVPHDQATQRSPFVFSTACWRHYIGTWELRDGRFYLVAVDGIYSLDSAEPLFADWFTGVLRIPSGKQLHYVHMGFGSIYEFETHIKIENGLVIDERRIDNRSKDINTGDLGFRNLPGGENSFEGDDL
jgi:hypothetical protein